MKNRSRFGAKGLENASFPYHNIFHSSNESSLFIICSAGFPQKKKKEKVYSSGHFYKDRREGF